MLTQSILKKTARLYTDKDLSDPMISPINNEFSGISPLLIQTGEIEVLVDDSKILSKKLNGAGAMVQLEIWEEMFHVFNMGIGMAVIISPESLEELRVAEVVEQDLKIEDGVIVTYRTKLRISFKFKDE